MKDLQTTIIYEISNELAKENRDAVLLDVINRLLETVAYNISVET
jgi:hypothetical protein